MTENEGGGGGDRIRQDSFKIFGVEFVNLLVSRNRKLQTMAVAAYMYLFLLVPWTTAYLSYYLFFYTDYKWIPLAYLTWMVADIDVGETGGRKKGLIRGWSLFRHYVDYFPVKLVKTCDLDPDQTYLFGSHPHGILCFGAFASFATEYTDFKKLFPGLFPRVLTLKQQFWLPGCRELIASSGLCSASKRGMQALLREPKGTVAVLIVGGATEAYNSDPFEIKLVLNRRKGFIKLALQHGRPLVPVFSFGEAFVYDQVHNPPGSMLRKFQDLYERLFAYPLPIIYGRGLFQYNLGYVPYRRPITVVVGAPLPVPHIPDPTVDDIAHWHSRYVDALKTLYADNNAKYGDERIKLVVT